MPLRVGIVGYGEIAGYHERHLRAAGARVVGAVTRRPLPRGLTRYPSLLAMLEEVDAVTVAVPNFLHAALGIEAIAAGVAVFVEKPLCIDAGDLAALQHALPHATVPVHAGFRLRWNPAVRALRGRAAAARRIRCVYRLGIERLAEGKPWTRQAAESGGAFFTLGVHALDLARWLAGAGAAPLADVRATTAHQDASADFPLVANLSGRLPNGVVIEAGADLRGGCGFQLELTLDDAIDALSYPELPAPRPADPGAADAEYGSMMRRFVEAVTRGEGVSSDVADLLQCHADLLAAQSMARFA